MSNFANLSANLNLNIQNFSSNMRNASRLMDRFAANMNGQINAGLIEPAKKAGVEYKDVARIVQGFLISKVFYGGLNAIRSATNAVWEFGKQLEYAKMAYANLFGDKALALEFINVLKDFAAVTPFSFQESEAAAKRLLAYGVQYKNVMYMMKGVLAASAMQGNPQVIESISRALGQIYTKGRLMNEEMRQLAEAGIPAYKILQEKLGLTAKQLQNLGREAIPASTAINALVDGMTERFGNVIDASVLTLQGIISNLKDNTTMLLAAVFDPLTQRTKRMLAGMGDVMFTLRDIQETLGTGGVFEKIVPKQIQNTVRIFAANLMTLWEAIKGLFGTTQRFGNLLAASLLPVLNLLIPVVVTIINVFAGLLRLFVGTTQGAKTLAGVLVAGAVAWALFRVQALATLAIASLIGVINGISKAILFLSGVLSKNWIVTAMILIAAGIMGVSVASTKAENSLNKLLKKFTTLNGVDPNKLFQPVATDRANDINKFNQALDGSTDSMSALEKKTNDAKKAAKSLLSFDEVYKLGSDSDAGADAADAAAEPITDGIFDGLSGDALLPDIPDFGDYSNNFVSELFEAVGDKLRSAGIGMGLGAIIGGIIGFLIGGPGGAVIGAKIGAVAGAIAGWFWEEIVKKLDPGVGGAYMGAAVGAGIGFIIGGPAGALIGAAIGAVAGWIAGKLWPTIKENLSTGTIGATALGAGIGGAIGMVVGGPAGALIGAAIGALVGWMAGMVKDNWPAITAYFTEGWNSVCTSIETARLAIGLYLVNLILDIEAWADGVTAKISKGFSDAWAKVQSILSNMVAGVSSYFIDLKNTIAMYIVGAALIISTGFTNAVADLKTSLDTMKTTAKTVLKLIYDVFDTWISDMWDNIFGKLFDWIKGALDALKGLAKNDTSGTVQTGITKIYNTRKAATGGIVSREEVITVGEGNKREGIIPLDNLDAMRPFSDKVAEGIMSVMLPFMANMNGGGGGGGDTIINAGVLVADDYGIKELERRLAIAREQEASRKG